MMTFQTLEVKLSEETLEALGLGGEYADEVEAAQLEGKTLEFEGQTFTLTKVKVEPVSYPCGFECCGTEGYYLLALGVAQ